MTDRESLLHAIAASPDDDALRLVYADWLEEHGDSARAEFVRVQVKVEAQGGKWRCPPSLWQRQEALWMANKEAWLAELPGGARDRSVFRKGLPHGVKVTARNFIKLGGKLVEKFPTIREATFENDGGAWKELVRCRALRHLRAVEMGNGAHNDDDWQAIHDAPHLGELVSLRLVGGSDPGPYWLGRVLKGLPALSGFSFEGAIALSDGWAHALGQEGGSSLEVLALHYVTLPDSGLRHLAPRLRSPALRSLTLLNCHTGDDGLAVLVDCRSPELRTLRFGYNDAGEEGGIRTLASVTWPHLWSLDLTGNPIHGPETVPHLVSPAFPALTALDLSYTEVNTDDIIHLVNQPDITRLKELRFHGVSLEDDAILAIASSPHLAGLEVLDISPGRFKFSDAAADALIASPFLNRLRSLCIFGHNLSGRALAALRSRFGVWC